MICKSNVSLPVISMTIFMALAVAGCSDSGEPTEPTPPQPATESAADSSAEQTVARADEMHTDMSAMEHEAQQDQDTDMAETDAEPADTEASASAASGEATTHTVIARATAFDPVAIRIQPGDTVQWTNMSGHNSHTYDDLIPEGAEGWLTPMGQDASVTLDVEGVYIYKCDPHISMGMVGAIIVGDPVNMEAVEANAQGMARRAVVKAKQAIE